MASPSKPTGSSAPATTMTTAITKAGMAPGTPSTPSVPAKSPKPATPPATPTKPRPDMWLAPTPADGLSDAEYAQQINTLHTDGKAGKYDTWKPTNTPGSFTLLTKTKTGPDGKNRIPTGDTKLDDVIEEIKQFQSIHEKEHLRKVNQLKEALRDATSPLEKTQLTTALEEENNTWALYLQITKAGPDALKTAAGQFYVDGPKTLEEYRKNKTPLNDSLLADSLALAAHEKASRFAKDFQAKKSVGTEIQTNSAEVKYLRDKYNELLQDLQGKGAATLNEAFRVGLLEALNKLRQYKNIVEGYDIPDQAYVDMLPEVEKAIAYIAKAADGTSETVSPEAFAKTTESMDSLRRGLTPILRPTFPQRTPGIPVQPGINLKEKLDQDLEKTYTLSLDELKKRQENSREDIKEVTDNTLERVALLDGLSLAEIVEAIQYIDSISFQEATFTKLLTKVGNYEKLFAAAPVAELAALDPENRNLIISFQQQRAEIEQLLKDVLKELAESKKSLQESRAKLEAQKILKEKEAATPTVAPTPVTSASVTPVSDPAVAPIADPTDAPAPVTVTADPSTAIVVEPAVDPTPAVEPVEPAVVEGEASQEMTTAVQEKIVALQLDKEDITAEEVLEALGKEGLAAKIEDVRDLLELLR